MSLTNYQQKSFHALMRECDKNDHIGHYDRVSIQEYLEENEYIILQRSNSKSVPLLRITLPLYMISYFLLFLFAGIKWIFTGYFYYDYSNPLLKPQRAWSKKLGLDYWE